MVIWVCGGVGKVRGAVEGVSVRMNGRLAEVAETGRILDTACGRRDVARAPD